jgi:hypothetical protein
VEDRGAFIVPSPFGQQTRSHQPFHQKPPRRHLLDQAKRRWVFTINNIANATSSYIVEDDDSLTMERKKATELNAPLISLLLVVLRMGQTPNETIQGQPSISIFNVNRQV